MKHFGLSMRFDGSNWGMGKYGVDQGILEELINDPKRYNEFLNTLTRKYNMSYQDAVRTCELLNSIGACSYASLANTIFVTYLNNPEQFEKDFGFSMYVKDGNGNFILNDAELLADLYIFYNKRSNGGTIFEDSLNQTTINQQNIDFSSNEFRSQEYTSKGNYGWNTSKINQYLNSKLNNKVFDFIGSIGPETYSAYFGENDKIVSNENEIKSEVQQAMIRGNNVQLLIFPDANRPMTLHGMNGNSDVICDGGHAMYVTRADEDQVIVSSWGKEFYITYQDLNNSKDYRFDFSVIREKNKIEETTGIIIENVLKGVKK